MSVEMARTASVENTRNLPKNISQYFSSSSSSKIVKRLLLQENKGYTVKTVKIRKMNRELK